MKIVVGLGNPGEEYAGTRHNLGFRVVDALAEKLGGVGFLPRGNFLLATTGDSRLLKPLTFMNRSGEALGNLLDEMDGEKPEIIVIADDVNLPLGKLRLRARGSCGGHNGLASIEQALGSDEYARLRIGVGNIAEADDLIEFVLGRFSEWEETILPEVIGTAAEAVLLWLETDLETSQARFNAWTPAAVAPDDKK
jgi:PTH1 family peptidyl-tRNA hydrolase